MLRLQTRNGEFIWLHSVFVIKGNIIQSQPSSSSASSISSSQESSPKRIRHLIHATYQVLTELEAATLQANEWIYAIKQHHFSREFSKEDFGESVSPDSSESDFNTGGEYTNEAAASQICVEIPLKHSTVNFPLQRSHHSLMTPEQHSSPDSSSSLSTAATKSFCLDSLPNFYPHEVSNMPLPELGDDLDEFFRQVENSPPPATAPQQPRGIKREWSEMSTGWNSNEHSDPLLYAEPPISQYKPQRHHSIQFGHHSECTWTDFNNNNNNTAPTSINPEVIYNYEPFQQPHLRAQRRLGSWAGLESA